MHLSNPTVPVALFREISPDIRSIERRWGHSASHAHHAAIKSILSRLAARTARLNRKVMVG